MELWCALSLEDLRSLQNLRGSRLAVGGRLGRGRTPCRPALSALETEIQKGEGERLEFKRDLNNEPLKWLKTVVAFALASAFAYMNLIENWGSGIKRTFKEFRAAGLRDPEFIVWPNAIRINVYRAGNNEVNIVSIGTNVDNRDGNDSNREGVNVGTNGTNVGTNDTNSAEETIISCVSKNLSITLDSLAECCEMSRRSVARTIKTLKEQGRIRRIGGTRGHWEVLK